MELIKEAVTIEQLVGSISAQAVVEGDLTLPAMKPDIMDLLLVQGKVTMGNVECVAGKLLMDGTVAFCVVYRGEDGITGFEATAGFKNTVDMEEAMPGMKGNVTAFIQQIDAYQLNERTIHVNAVVEMECSVFSVKDEVLIKDIQDDMNYETLWMSTSIPDIGRCENKLSIREDVVLPPSALPIKEALFADGYARIKNIREQAGEMLVSGEIKILLTYSSTENTLEQTQLMLPVDFVLKCEKISDESKNFALLKIQEIYVKKADDEGKVVSLDVELKASGYCIKQHEMDLIRDCYSTTHYVDMNHRMLQTIIPVKSSNMRSSVRAKVFIPEGHPPCARPLVCYANPIITQKTVVQDGLELLGVVTIHLVYEQHNGQKYAFTAQVPFTTELEVVGLNNTMGCDVEIATEGCYASGNGNEIEVKVSMDIELRCYQNWSVPIVESIVEGEKKPESTMGIGIYFVGDGETLWSIAKKFNMTGNMILKHNPSIDKDGVLPAGQKLLLFRRCAS